MKDIIENIIGGAVAIVAILGSFLFVIGLMLAILSPFWIPFLLLAFIIK